MFGIVTCFIRRVKTVAIDDTGVWESYMFYTEGKTVAIDGTDVWDSYMFYKEGEDSSN